MNAATTTGQAPLVVYARASSLSRRGRALAVVIAALLMLSGLLFAVGAGATPLTDGSASGGVPTQIITDATGSGWQNSNPQSGGTAGSGSGGLRPDTGGLGPIDAAPQVQGALVGRWNGNTIHLDWQNQPFVTAETSFVGDRVIVPGDRVARTMYIENVGPGPAVLTVALNFARLIDDGATNLDLYHDVTIFWAVDETSGSCTFAELYYGYCDNEIGQARVGRGETAQITLGFDFPADVDTHYTSVGGGVASKVLLFDMITHMTGDMAALPEAPQRPSLPETGANIAGAVALAAALGILGWLIFAAARRRRCELCDRALPIGGRETRCDGAPLVCEVAIALVAE